MKYTYPAIFTPEDKGLFSVDFPDLEGCHTCGDNITDALMMAEDALCLVLYDYEINKKTLPAPSHVNDIKHRDDEFVTLVKCDTDAYRRFYKNKVVKKTLTIPEWLNEEAMLNGLNFSHILQEALMNTLQIK